MQRIKSARGWSFPIHSRLFLGETNESTAIGVRGAYKIYFSVGASKSIASLLTVQPNCSVNAILQYQLLYLNDIHCCSLMLRGRALQCISTTEVSGFMKPVVSHCQSFYFIYM